MVLILHPFKLERGITPLKRSISQQEAGAFKNVKIDECCDSHGVESRGADAHEHVLREVLFPVFKQNVACPKLHHQNAQHVGEPVADDHCGQKPTGVYELKPIPKGIGDWEVKEDIIPPRKG